MYKKIKIENFRGITELEIKDAGQFNLFVGENNCGKTSILEGIFLLTGPTNPKLPISINAFRGHGISQWNEYSWSVIFNKLDIHSTVRMSGEISEPNEKRFLEIKPIIEEYLSKVSDVSIPFAIKDSQTTIPERVNGLWIEISIQKGNGKKIGPFRSNIKIKDNNLQIVPAEDYKNTFPGRFFPGNPNNLIEDDTVSLFSKVQQNKQEKNVIEILKKIEPQLVDITIGAGDILYCDMGFPKLLPLKMAGEGLYRILKIILYTQAVPGGVVLIDEIENGLYVSSQDILWEAIFEAARVFNVQVFATTHSYENVKAFSAAYEKLNEKNDKLRLYRIEKEVDQYRVIDYDHDILKTSLESNWEVR